MRADVAIHAVRVPNPYQMLTDFTFDGVAFLWNPEDPGFSIAMNKVSFYAIGFEKYICLAMQEVEKRITDPAVLEEARAFRAQEALHSTAHRKHVRALIEQHPQLQRRYLLPLRQL